MFDAEGGTCLRLVKFSRLAGPAAVAHHAGMDTPSVVQEKKTVPTVSRVAGDTIIELVYDAAKGKTGLAVSRFGGLWNVEQEVVIGTGEVLVPYSAKNNLIATNCVLLPSIPVHHGDKAELLADIQAFLHRYVDLSPTFERIAAYYVLLSWVYDAFNELPYLRLRGEYGTGKTRGLLAIGALCYRAFFASGASTISPIFHTLDRVGGTLVIDEADFRFSDATSDIVKVLNNGNVKGLPVLRTMQSKDREFNPRAFRVFGPKIVAMRGSFDDPALESRFLTEEMGHKSLRADISIPLPNTLHEEALALRNRLLHYRFGNLVATKPDMTALLEGVEPRVNQIALPLLSLVDEPEVRADIRDRLLREQETRSLSRRETSEGRVVAALCQAMAASSSAPLTVGAVTDRFNSSDSNAYHAPVSEKWVGRVLRTQLRLATEKSHGVYVVPTAERAKIAALAARYNCSAGPTTKSMLSPVRQN